MCKRYTRKECRFPGASCGFLTYVGADETSSSHRWCRQPLDPEPRLAVTPQRGAPSSRHEPPRAARRRELSQAAATAASAAPPPRRPLHRGRFSARMVPALAISSSPCARPSQRARPKNRLRARRRGWAPSARHAERHLCGASVKRGPDGIATSCYSLTYSCASYSFIPRYGGDDNCGGAGCCSAC